MQIRNFIHHETAGSLVLILATLAALFCANSGLAGLYTNWLNSPLGAGFTVQTAFIGLEKPVFLWINDVLMSFFFLLVGLEIKREILAGELSNRHKILQPVFAAIGGVVVPILFFVGVNYQSPETLRGWAVPCATDIAFALGILALLGSRVPAGIKILLTAIAIIDDLIAVLVIALFYSGDLQFGYLVLAAIGAGILAFLNYRRARRTAFYLLAGALVWTGFLKAGIHPTLAGIVTAMAIPLRDKKSKPVLERLEKRLHPWVVFAIVPVFAFANAGLDLAQIDRAMLGGKLAFGILLGLMIGKPLGIFGGLWLGHRTGLAPKPKPFRWRDYAGLSALCGIGFTMALFIGEIGFSQPEYLAQVKAGILVASFVMALCGFLICFVTFERKTHV